MVTADEIPDPGNLDMWLDVNGTRSQTGNTSTMIFGVAALIAYLSRIMTLLPGDVISTGTPPCVGAGFKPPVFLEDGDTFVGMYPHRNFPIHHNGFRHDLLRDLLLNHDAGFILSYNDCATIREECPPPQVATGAPCGL